MAPASALRVSRNPYDVNDERFDDLSKAAQFAFARAQLKSDESRVLPRSSVERKGAIADEEAVQASVLVHAILASERLTPDTTGANIASTVGLRWLTHASQAVLLMSVIALLHAIFVSGYNFHQQDFAGLFRAGLGSLAATLLGISAFALLRRLREISRDFNATAIPARARSRPK